METALESVRTNWTMHWIDAADHSFRVPKSSGRTEAGVDAEIGDASSGWLATVRGER
jgi:hypothetical protein